MKFSFASWINDQKMWKKKGQKQLNELVVTLLKDTYPIHKSIVELSYLF